MMSFWSKWKKSDQLLLRMIIKLTLAVSAERLISPLSLLETRSKCIGAGPIFIRHITLSLSLSPSSFHDARKFV